MLQLQQINVTFHEGTPNEKIALRDIHLTLQPGDFVTIIGSNGAGKSTLMNVVSGVLSPDTGSILLNGIDMTNLTEQKRARSIGRVFQDPLAGTAPHMTIEENLVMGLGRSVKRSLKPGVTKRRQNQFREVLASLSLGLEDRLSAKVGMLSGGERQALSLLMATFTNPSLLLLDEHTAALDPARAQLITELTKEIVQSTKLTTMMVTHNMQQAIDLGNRLIMMDKGQIIFHADEEEKKKLTVSDLLEAFRSIRGEALSSDRTMLSSVSR
ncbi:ABC transporter ATP-binding protein [Bacillus fonticola]|uniref:ABC transporter ATP-binding protein n=1 Tax=Bacillus fonticola TaxID=2728853 RepID=UPI001473B23A|nr:ATP-binding cassette domain-containing protein [Bacillus fonticola]